MAKVKNFLLNRIIKRKRISIPLGIVIVIVLIFVFQPSSRVKNTVTNVVKYSDLKQTVLATGQVVSNTDLNLSFNKSGIVKSIKVKVGDQVKAGDILATLDQASEFANLTSARGNLAAANARYKKILEGATNEDIALSQVILDQAKITQKTLVDNAYNALLNSYPEAVPAEDDTSLYESPTITGTYSLGKEGKIYMRLYNSSGGISYSLSGLVEGTGLVDSVIPQPLGNSGLSIKFSNDDYIDVKDWIIEIPNKQASNYLTNYNAYQTTIAQAKSTIDQREAELALKKAEARPSDIELAKADIIGAQGQVELADARYKDTMILAPADGTITRIDIKPGELASALAEVIVLQDVSNIYLEANINEANIANIKIGMPIDITYDAFGTDKVFTGNITKIDPSSTIVSGVVNYKITASVEQINDLRPGMTANMTIKVKEKNHTLSIPSRAVLVDSLGDKTIRLIINSKKKKWKEVPVTTGLEADGGLVEITSGLKENDEFVVLIKTK